MPVETHGPSDLAHHFDSYEQQKESVIRFVGRKRSPAREPMPWKQQAKRDQHRE